MTSIFVAMITVLLLIASASSASCWSGSKGAARGARRRSPDRIARAAQHLNGDAQPPRAAVVKLTGSTPDR